jgi:hypothetical protein
MPTRIHDEIIEEFVPTCRHCKKLAEHHVGGHLFPRQADQSELMFHRPWPCLFDSTSWDPMSSSEWVAWRRAEWTDWDNGTNYLRKQLINDGFAARLQQDAVVYGTAAIGIDVGVDKLSVQRLDPTTLAFPEEE